MDDLGFLPLLTGFLPDTTDDTMYVAAKSGLSAGPEAYMTASAAMTSTPKTRKAAYEQAVYWLSFAARRADYEGNKDAQNALFVEAQQVYNSFHEKTSLGILGEASRLVEDSTLNPLDKAKITKQLNTNWWGVARRQGALGGALVLAAGGLAYWIRQR